MRGRVGTLAGVVGLLSLTAAVVRAQESPAAQPRVDVADAIEVSRLVELAAERMAVRIEYESDKLPREKVSVRIPGGLTDRELWDLANQLLASRGFTTVLTPESDVLSVVNVQRARAATRVYELDGERGGRLPEGIVAGFVSTVYAPEHRKAELLSATMTRVLGGGSGAGGGGGGHVTIEHAEQRGMLVISGLTPHVRQALELLRGLDAPAAAIAVEAIEAVNLPAARLAVLVNQVEAKRKEVSGFELAGQVLEGPDGRSLLVIAPAGTLDQWRSLIESLDRLEPVETRTYVPGFFPPAEVGRLITESIGTIGPGAAGEASRFRVVINELTGSLIVTATPTQHEQIDELMTRLDDIPPEARTATRRFTLRNRSADEVLGVLQGLIEAGALGAGSGAGPGGGPGAGQPSQSRTRDPRSPVDANDAALDARRDMLDDSVNPAIEGVRGGDRGERRERGRSTRAQPQAIRGAIDGVFLSMTIDEATNTLIAIGEPRVLDQLGDLVESLDVAQPQVRLEVALVSLSDGQSRDLAVELARIIDLPGNGILTLASLFGLEGLPTEGASAVPEEGSGFLAAALNPGEYAAVVRAIENVSDGRSLSRPHVLVSNNQPASFDSTTEQPFVSTNASNTVATTSFGGSVPAGTVVSVTPRIAQGDHLELEYNVSLSSFVGESADPALPPPRQQSALQSIATIPDGYTVVVGGIETVTEGEAETKVPILGDIPLLGLLFKSTSKSYSRSRFFVFIRADVMRGTSFEMLRYASDLAVEEADIDGGWPEVEPRVIR